MSDTAARSDPRSLLRALPDDYSPAPARRGLLDHLPHATPIALTALTLVWLLVGTLTLVTDWRGGVVVLMLSVITGAGWLGAYIEARIAIRENAARAEVGARLDAMEAHITAAVDDLRTSLEPRGIDLALAEMNRRLGDDGLRT